MARPVRRAGPGIAGSTATEALHRRPGGTTKSRAAWTFLSSPVLRRVCATWLHRCPVPVRPYPARPRLLGHGCRPEGTSSMRSASSSHASGSPVSGGTTPVGTVPSSAATPRSAVTRTEHALEDPSSQEIPAAGASTLASGSALPDLADLAPELGFLELLEPEERAQWISGWLEPRVLRPRVRQHLRRRALLLELDEVVACCWPTLERPRRHWRGRSPSRDCGQVAVSLRPGRLRARGPPTPWGCTHLLPP